MTVDYILVNELLLNLLNVIIMMLPLIHFMEFRNKYGLLMSGMNAVVIVAAFQLCRYYLHLPVYVELIVGAVIFCLYVHSSFDDKWVKKIVLALVSLVSFLGANGLAALWMKRLLDVSLEEKTERGMPWLLFLVFVAILQFVLSKLIMVLFSWIYEKKPLKELIGYLLVPVYQFILLVLYYHSVDNLELDIIVFGWVSFFMALVLEYFLLYLAGIMKDKAEVEEQLTNLYVQRQEEMAYYQMTQSNIQEMRKIRHEFVNQIQTAYLLIEQGSTVEEAKELLQKSHQQVKNISFSQYCDNSVINAIISVKAAKAKEHNIEFSALCQMVELDSVEEVDLCSLFGNLLDNAIEACTKMGEEADKSVSLKSYNKGGYQIVRVENTYAESELNRDFLKTSKSDRTNHGFGMKVIDKISKKYGGEVRTEITENKVLITVYLSLEQIKGKNK